MINRLTIVFGFFTCGILLLFCKSNQSEKDRPHSTSLPTDSLPNIILLIGDDQGYPYFGFMGAEYVHTPHLDHLAKEGTVFTNGYVSDNHCRPSLQTLLTGILPIDYHRQAFKIMDEEIEKYEIPPDSVQSFKQDFDRRAEAFERFPLLPKLLQEIGYISFQGGKWWEFSYQNGGFTHGMTEGWSETDLKGGNWFKKHMGGDGLQLGRVTNQAAYDFIQEAQGKPFFMWLAPSLPHYPFDAPAKYYDLYKDQEMSESAKRYYANCTWFDDSWGEMATYLRENNLYDNTLIIYVNDNGWEQDPLQEFWDDPMRSHNGGDKGKGSIYDLSFRSPIIFSWPRKIKPSQRHQALIHSADIPATILDYVGLDIPDAYHGISYRSVIEGKRDQLREHIQGNVITTRSRDPENVMGRHVEGYWIREAHWFLRWHTTDEELELFDLRNDKRNDHDVSDLYPQITKELYSKLTAYKNKWGIDPRIAYYSAF